jgi:thiamine pyrophosphate-dependent acetolactate synthase large subunit-like protein
MIRSERPTVPPSVDAAAQWGSDAMAELLRELELPFVALNPGASYRGLHDSLVNHLGNQRPAIVLCLHEEHAVAIAHGYAKVTERPMAVALHSNVGLMHATMALFNAFCDRVPMLVLGATGPLDAAARRPWIDWIHTAADQAALVRSYVKWDDQPGSVPAALEAITHGAALTGTYPCAPVYVCLDAGLQEAPLTAPVALPPVGRYRPPEPPAPGAADLDRVDALLAGARRPLILLGRLGRARADWDARVRVAEAYGAAVLTDLKLAAAFPTAHRLNPAAPGAFLTPEGAALVREADAILALDWVDLGGTLRQAHGGDDVPAQVAICSCDHVLHNGWSKDHFSLPPADLAIQCHPDLLVRALDERASVPRERRPGWPPARVDQPRRADQPPRGAGTGRIEMADLAHALTRATAGRPTCLVRLPLGFAGADLVAAGPLDYLGQDGGAGLASGPGMAVGAALALRDSERLAIAVLGDGDFLMGATALWTAAHLRLRLLIVVANNRSYLNDEIHQERIARHRERPVENRWVGQRIDDPPADVAMLARSLGAVGHGPVSDPDALEPAIAEALAAAWSGATVVLDVQLAAQAYDTAPAPPRGRA